MKGAAMHRAPDRLQWLANTLIALTLSPTLLSADSLHAQRASASNQPVVGQQADDTITLYRGQSRVIRPPWPAEQVSITDPNIANVEVLAPRRVQVQGQKPGKTDITITGGENQVWRRQVDVGDDVRHVDARMQALFPAAELDVSQVDDLMIIQGRLPRAEQAQQLHQFLDATGQKYVDMTRIAGQQQVQLQVRVAEVSRRALRTLGINTFAGGSDVFGGVQVGSETGPLAPINIGLPQGASAEGGASFQFLEDTGVPTAATVFAGFPSADLQTFIRALEENQYLRLLAEPNLVAMSGEQASFLAGGEFPIPVVQGTDGNTSISIEFKEFGVRLRFRPVVLGEGTIRLHVQPEVSELSNVGAVEIQGFQVPSLLSRRAETTVELKSGQTFGIAGLIDRSTSARLSEMPGLGRLPVLGTLFRSVSYRQEQTELVVMVTANLVEPISTAEQLPAPGDLHRDPTGWELYLEGRIQGKNPPRLSPKQKKRMRELGFDRLHGPGAWASYGQRSTVASDAPDARNASTNTGKDQ
jgi:pilus assembly protein CpaC